VFTPWHAAHTRTSPGWNVSQYRSRTTGAPAGSTLCHVIARVAGTSAAIEPSDVIGVVDDARASTRRPGRGDAAADPRTCCLEELHARDLVRLPRERRGLSRDAQVAGCC
jgi:hypothetical protein